MGYYIGGLEPHNKATQICQLYGGQIVDINQAEIALHNENLGVIVILDNGLFEAAGFAYNEREFKVFASDERPKQFVILPIELAKSLTGYRGN